VLEVLGILRLDNISHEALNSLVVLHPLVNERLGQVLLGLRGRRHGLDSRLAAVGSLSLRGLGLALTSLGGLSRSSCRWATGATVVIVNTLHVVAQVPLAGESISVNSTLTALINTKERLVTMAVESVSLTLMAEQASSGREAGALAWLSLAAVGLQVRVNKLAKSQSQYMELVYNSVVSYS
jgi:hypothetical protein